MELLIRHLWAMPLEMHSYTDSHLVLASKVGLRTNRMISNNFFTFSEVKVWLNEPQWDEAIPNSCLSGLQLRSNPK